MQNVGLVVPEGLKVPVPSHAGFTHRTPGVPPQWNKMSKPGPWQGFAAGAWWLLSPPTAKETRAWNMAMLLGLACGGKANLFVFKSPIIKTELKIASQSQGYYLS